MKRILILCSVIIAVLAMNACEKLPKGTGVLKVEVSVFYVEDNVRIYPYGFDDYTKPLYQAMAVEGKHQTFTFILNAGNYIVDCHGRRVVQIHEGEEVTVRVTGGRPDDSWRDAPKMYYDPHPDKHFRR